MAPQKKKAAPVGGNTPVKKNKGGAPKGNQNAVGNSGKPKYIETPELLLELFTAYVKAAKNNPYLIHDFVGKDANEVRKEKERPLSWVGFECYLFDEGIIGDLDDYERNTNQSYLEYQPIIRAIKKYIDKDQFEGASAGIYNANIIARKLGLADKQELKVSEVEVFIGGENVTSEYEA
jgi:hypothetical protein